VVLEYGESHIRGEIYQTRGGCAIISGGRGEVKEMGEVCSKAKLYPLFIKQLLSTPLPLEKSFLPLISQYLVYLLEFFLGTNIPSK